MRGAQRDPWTRADTNDVDTAALLGVGGGEPAGRPFVGVRALMLAMLEDAIRAYLGPDPRAGEEAAAWIADARRVGVFSFSVVCDTLGLEATAVRSALARLRIREVGYLLARGRSRPNSRRQAGLRLRASAPPTGGLSQVR
jgi:hypothetical protein